METRLKRRAVTVLPSETLEVGDYESNNQLSKCRVGRADVQRPRSSLMCVTDLGTSVTEVAVRSTQACSTPLPSFNMATAQGLHRTVEKCRFHHLRFLLNFGTKLSLKNEQGEGVLVTALKIPNDRLREKMFHFLLRKGASCEDVESPTGRDAFLWTCYLGHDAQVKQLLRNCLGDINFHLKDRNGKSGLHYVVSARKLDLVTAIVKCMNKFDVSVDIPDSEGVTPFIYAKRLGYRDIEEALVKEGNACPTQFDFETLHLVGSSTNEDRSSPKQRRVASALCHGTRLNMSRGHGYNQTKRCLSSVSRSSSFFGREINTRKVAHSDGDNTSSSSSSAQSRNGLAWALTGLSKKHKRSDLGEKNNEYLGTNSSVTSRSCWTATSSHATTVDESNGQTGGNVTVGTRPVLPNNYRNLSYRTNNVCPGAAKVINQSSLTPKTSGQTSSGCIDVTRTLSTHCVDTCHGDGNDNLPTRSNHGEVPGVQTMFQYMSMQLTPAFRPKADEKNAYKPPPKPKPRLKPSGGWGVISFMSKLKARSQRTRMQSLAKGGGATSGPKVALFKR